MPKAIIPPEGHGAFAMIIAPAVAVLNHLERDGWIGRYAIAGAMGIIYYIEPFTTYDLDIIAVLPTTPGGLVDVSGVYRHLTGELGYAAAGEHVVIAGIPVQILAVYDDLTQEALREAVEIPVGQETSRILSFEHLLAIAVKTGRTKDLLRINLALESRAPDMERLNAILARHGLTDAWARATGGRG